MQTHLAKRVEIIIEAPMETRLTEALEQAGVTGFTVLPVLGGSGRSGRWSREGQIGRAGMVALLADDCRLVDFEGLVVHRLGAVVAGEVATLEDVAQHARVIVVVALSRLISCIVQQNEHAVSRP